MIICQPFTNVKYWKKAVEIFFLNAFFSFAILLFNCLIEINPCDTPQNVRQNIHIIGTSIGNKRLVDLIADSVKGG